MDSKINGILFILKKLKFCKSAPNSCLMGLKVLVLKVSLKHFVQGIACTIVKLMKGMQGKPLIKGDLLLLFFGTAMKSGPSLKFFIRTHQKESSLETKLKVTNSCCGVGVGGIAIHIIKD